MTEKVPYQPKDYHSITPYVIVSDATKAIEFYKTALNATEVLRLTTPDGDIAHAEIQIGDSRIMMSNESPEYAAYSPLHYEGSPVKFMVYVKDVDQDIAQAVEAGMEILMPATDMFYGDRCGNVKDPYGYQWSLATHIEDMTQEEAQKRFDQWMAEQA